MIQGGCLSSDLFRTNKHREKEDGGAIAQKTYFYQADDVAEYVLQRNIVPDLSVFFVYCGYVFPLLAGNPADRCPTPDLYSRSPKNPAPQQLQKSSKSASAGSLRPIWNSFATVGVRDFWENGYSAFSL